MAAVINYYVKRVLCVFISAISAGGVAPPDGLCGGTLHLLIHIHKCVVLTPRESARLRLALARNTGTAAPPDWRCVRMYIYIFIKS